MPALNMCMNFKLGACFSFLGSALKVPSIVAFFHSSVRRLVGELQMSEIHTSQIIAFWSMGFGREGFQSFVID